MHFEKGFLVSISFFCAGFPPFMDRTPEVIWLEVCRKLGVPMKRVKIQKRTLLPNEKASCFAIWGGCIFWAPHEKQLLEWHPHHHLPMMYAWTRGFFNSHIPEAFRPPQREKQKCRPSSKVDWKRAYSSVTGSGLSFQKRSHPICSRLTHKKHGPMDGEKIMDAMRVLEKTKTCRYSPKI